MIGWTGSSNGPEPNLRPTPMSVIRSPGRLTACFYGRRNGRDDPVGGRMSVQTMSPVDASFLHIEDAVTHMHIGSVGIFEGPAPSRGEAQAAVGLRLPLVPRYRQKVRFVPLALGRPVWVDDPHFNLDYHVRRTALPSPGGDDELRNLVGRVMSQQLDRPKPLWEMWVVEGLGEDHWGLISKTHHCMV